MSASAFFLSGRSPSPSASPGCCEPVGACSAICRHSSMTDALDRPVEVESLADGAGGGQDFVGGEVQIHVRQCGTDARRWSPWTTSTRPTTIAINLANWNSRVPHPRAGIRTRRVPPTTRRTSRRWCSSICLGSATSTGCDGVHLQCHIGTDTVSLARLGARMTGLDFSAPALEVARRLAADCGARRSTTSRATCTARSTRSAPSGSTSCSPASARCAGCPTSRRWAQVVAALLRPGGFLFIREGPSRCCGRCASRAPTG